MCKSKWFKFIVQTWKGYIRLRCTFPNEGAYRGNKHSEQCKMIKILNKTRIVRIVSLIPGTTHHGHPVKCRMSNVGCRMSELGCLMSDLGCRMAPIRTCNPYCSYRPKIPNQNVQPLYSQGPLFPLSSTCILGTFQDGRENFWRKGRELVQKFWS